MNTYSKQFMSISILNHKSARLTDNSTLLFNDTSFDLNDSMNLFVISDYVLSDLSCTLSNTSDSISIYSFDTRKYQIILRGSCDESGDIDFQGLEFSVISGQSLSVIADSLISALTQYSNVVKTVSSDHVLITFENSESGVSANNLIDDDLSVFGLIFDISVLNNGNAIQTVSALTLNNIQTFQQSNRYIYKLNILFRPKSEEGEHVDDYLYKHTATANISITCNLIKTDFTFNLIGYGIAQNDKYIIALQNVKKFITNDYYTAFMKSDYNEPIQDNLILNNKRQEYLIELLNLTGFIGAYKSLLSAISYFGYGELLSLKELWLNAYSEYKHTDIANAVLSHIDKSLVGFSKTNQMTLVYQINTEKTTEPQFDSDGLEYYVNVLYNTDEILTKLNALKNILERDFMPLNTKIVDITGEYKSILGIDTIIWETLIRISDYNLTENLNSTVSASIVSSTIDILNHKCLIQPWSVIADTTTSETDLKFIDNIITAFHNATFFEIDSIISVDDETAEDYDIATRFISEDFGLIQIDVVLSNVSAFYEYSATLYKAGAEVLQTRRHVIADITEGIKIAVKELGTYDVKIMLFDNYGGSVLIGLDDIIIQNRHTDFKLYRTINKTNQPYTKDIKLSTTYQTNTATGLVQIDPLDEGLSHVLPSPNLTWDPFTGIDRITTNQHLVSKHFKYDVVNTSTRKTLVELAGLPINEMTDVNISSFGYRYGTWLIDVVGSGEYGRRRIEMKLFKNKEFHEVALAYSSSMTALSYVQQYVSALTTAGGVYDYFTYSINHFSVDNTLTNVRPMIRMTAKNPSFINTNLILSVTNAFNPLFTNGFEYNTIESVLPMSVGFELLYNDTTAIRQLVVTYNNVNVTQNIAFLNRNDMISKLRSIFTANNFDITIFDNNGSTVFISSNADLYLSHDALGINYDICRGNFNSKVYGFVSGSELVLGETVYAVIDEDSKIDNRDIVWTLSDSLTNTVLEQQNSYAFRTVLTNKRSYTLKLETSDRFGSNARVKNGCMLIQ